MKPPLGPVLIERATRLGDGLELLRPRLEELGDGPSDPEAVTANLAAARRVCEMVEGMFGTEAAGEEMQAN